MDPRYRYSGRRSPTLYNPARASLPLNLLHPEQNHHHHPHHHLHAVPTARREVIPISVSQPRTSAERINIGGPVTTTTYKIKADPSRSSNVREASRTRRATLDSHVIPTVITTSVASPTVARHRPVVHGNGNGRASPVPNPYRSSGEDQYYAVPASSGKHRHHHTNRYSVAMDNADMTRLAREREASNRLAIDRSREGQAYTATARPRTTYTTAVVRHPDTVADDYGDDGYGYTNPKDLVQYDLNTSGRRPRRDSYDGSRGRPSSTQSYDQVSRSYDNRERGPPPSTRGFAQVNARTWPIEPQPAPPRLTVPPLAPMDPIQRPASARPVEAVQRPVRVESYGDNLQATGLQRRSSDRRPVSVYQDRERRQPREETRDYYDPRDDDIRRERKHRREPSRDEVEQRGFGIRQDRVERDDRSEAPRVERPDRAERVERVERTERPEHKSGRDALTAGLSTAAAALGIGAITKKSSRDEGRDDREDREDQRIRREEREERDEQRRRRDREERETMEREARHRDEREDRTAKTARDEGFQDVRQPQRHNSRDERDFREDEPRRLRPEPSMTGAGLKPREDSPGSDEAARPRKPRSRRQSGATGTFNPRDALDLKALKEELANAAPPLPPKEPLDSAPTTSTPPRDTERTEIRDDRGRLGPLAPAANERQLRVVSPPRDQAHPPADKPVKGILRQPREKFPEDPAPIREGVAPLKDSKKDGIPPDARWTKISRKLVNPDALEAGKERYEAREDFVIVLRVLTREEVQAYAVATQQIRAAREEEEEAQEREERRRARRERHERHKRERENHGRGESTHRSRRHRHGDSPSDSQSDETTDEDQRSRVKMLEPAPRGSAGIPGQVAGPSMSGGLGDAMPTSSRRRDD
ncbi:hypothetical protein BP5796_09410 [Coleophoma crateriformis]|uniref:DUF8035 domain-containing protein n=1 Tax=Coleophoma crateriformis TaxID=565419 RepID=A0A3D8QYA8_9HELO|nr:hypothetical protein BP5796_09410 [Coleophoma crateriformis]